MSVFHRVDDLDALTAAVFLPRMVRLPHYDGAVRHVLRREGEQPSTAVSAPARATAPAEQAASVHAHTVGELSRMNQTKEYGPLGVNQAGVFDVG
jgi:hypothetical protein